METVDLPVRQSTYLQEIKRKFSLNNTLVAVWTGNSLSNINNIDDRVNALVLVKIFSFYNKLSTLIFEIIMLARLMHWYWLSRTVLLGTWIQTIGIIFRTIYLNVQIKNHSINIMRTLEIRYWPLFTVPLSLWLWPWCTTFCDETWKVKPSGNGGEKVGDTCC